MTAPKAALEVSLSLNPDHVAAARESVASLVEASVDFVEVSACFAIVDGDLGDLATVRAGELGLSLECTDLFRRFATAVSALNIDGYIVQSELRHGWPILSLGASNTPSVAEGAVPGNRAAPEGPDRNPVEEA